VKMGWRTSYTMLSESLPLQLWSWRWAWSFSRGGGMNRGNSGMHLPRSRSMGFFWLRADSGQELRIDINGERVPTTCLSPISSLNCVQSPRGKSFLLSGANLTLRQNFRIPASGRVGLRPASPVNYLEYCKEQARCSFISSFTPP